jgi:hypothetical protein
MYKYVILQKKIRGKKRRMRTRSAGLNKRVVRPARRVRGGIGMWGLGALGMLACDQVAGGPVGARRHVGVGACVRMRRVLG